MSEVKLKKVILQGRSVGEVIEKVLEHVADGYVFDKDMTYRVGYVHYVEMKLGEEAKPVKKATAKKAKVE